MARELIIGLIRILLEIWLKEGVGGVAKRGTKRGNVLSGLPRSVAVLKFEEGGEERHQL